MRLNKLSFKDKTLFDKYLDFSEHQLAVYAFANIYIWRKFFDINWVIIDNSLCVFFTDNIGTFLYFSPLNKVNSKQVINETFKILDQNNKNKEFSHIENVEEKDLKFFQDSGFDCPLKSYDYICASKDLALLQGNKFKSKRSGCNYFTKHYNYKFQKLSLKHEEECLNLYALWMKQHQAHEQDHVYQGLLSDSRIALKEAFTKYGAFGFKGAVVKVNNIIKGFTFGFSLNKDTFCILYEITDLTVKGLAQFIFREFSRELIGYRYINIMDDSGLDNLKQVKLSYHPQKKIPAYIVRRRAL